MADRVAVGDDRDRNGRLLGVVEVDYGLAPSFKDPDGKPLEVFHLTG